jgi:uncharacterized repeat protein (TIGR03803 family)
MTQFLRRAALGAAAIAVLAGAISPALAQSFQTLYAFPTRNSGTTGYFPRGGLAMDSAGALYGTTVYGGNCPINFPYCGTIYKLTPPAAGQTAWTHQLLHAFSQQVPIQGYNEDGISPIAPLTNYQNVFYGTASAGGDTNCGCGNIFSITPSGTYTILHVFGPYDFVNHVWTNGTTPIGGLLIDTDGTMYGTTNAGGLGQPGPHNSFGAGIIYKISTSGTGFTKLHDFDGDQNGGPQGELMFGQDGYIYGTQYGGGQYNEGVVFRIAKNGSGYQVLYNFKGVNQPGGSTDGAQPEGRLAQDPDGTIYGTTTIGGSPPSGYGTAWSLKFNGSTWDYKQLYIFGSPGNLPHNGLILAADGNLYGTGAGGGDFQNGVIYRLVRPATQGGQWTYQLLHSFKGIDPNGDTPYGDLLYANGKFYGENLSGGDTAGCPQSVVGCGTVFQYSFLSPHDFNGNGKSDIAWRDSSGNAALWLMNGGSVSSSGGIGNVPSAWSIVGQRDFNGDGKHDLLWRDTSGNTAIWFLNGLQVSSSSSIGNVPTTWTVVGTADFNGDGKGDILWHSNTGVTAIWLMNGTQVSLSASLGTIPTSWSAVGTADFNGDGKADILWRDTGGNTAIWFMNGTQISSTSSIGNVPTSWTIVATGDFNGDGKADILWRDGSGNTAIWLMNGASVSSSAGLGVVPTTWSVKETGDYNGDGKADILWRDTSGNTAIWFMSGTAGSSTAGLGTIATSWTIQGTNVD